MVAMVDAFEGRTELPLELSSDALAEDVRDFVGGEFIEAQFTGSFEELVNGERFSEDEIQAIFDLAESIKPMEFHGLTLSFGELGTQEKRPGIESFLQQFRGQTVRSLLKDLRVINGQKGIILFSEGNAGSIQFGFEKGVTVDPVSGLEGEKGSDSYDHGSQFRISEVEVVMGKPAARFMEDRMIGIFRGKLGGAAAKGGPLLHTLVDEVDAISILTFHPVE